ncbi:MAG: DUF1440 domain-containing protein [Planctomycetaceae bacterium]|nr:DUF1440 domain-containing protein [Planctomycetaceae bacterium]
MIATCLRSAAAGLIATLPMTIAMVLMRRALPRREQYPLPPRQITEQFVESVGATDLNETQTQALTAFAHFGYGGAAGGVYGTLVEQGLPANAATGVIFGLGVWSGSYLGLLPALHVLSPATEHPARRNALMIAAHVVWGGALGMLTERWNSKRHNYPPVTHPPHKPRLPWQRASSLQLMNRDRLTIVPGSIDPLPHIH